MRLSIHILHRAPPPTPHHPYVDHSDDAWKICGAHLSVEQPWKRITVTRLGRVRAKCFICSDEVQSEAIRQMEPPWRLLPEAQLPGATFII